MSNKKVFRTFFLDPADGQEKWLNQMAQRGLRLVSVNFFTYEFEPCELGEYEYHIEVVKGKHKEEILDRQKYLARRGIKSIPRSATGARVDTTSKSKTVGSGSSQITLVSEVKLPELLILERTKDSKEFEMYADTAFRSRFYQSLRSVASVTEVVLMLLALMMALTLDGSWFFTGLTLVMVGVILYLSFRLARLTEQAFHFKEQKKMRKEQAALKKQEEMEKKNSPKQ